MNTERDLIFNPELNLRGRQSDIERESSSSFIVTRISSKDAPNVSLNAHTQFGRGKTMIVAAVATALQLSVLVFSGFATLHPKMSWRKDGNAIARYAFPCNLVGTLTLVVGMMLCARVVESRTHETHHLVKNGKEARIVWLQKTQRVNDQDFKSFAIFSEKPHTIITTSRRKGEDGPPDTTLILKAVAGTILCLVGYVVQFIGLRGLHFSSSIAQLVAVLFMIGLRALARRGLAKPLRHEKLDQGFELDWFAITMANVDEAPWRPGTSSPKVIWELAVCDSCDQHVKTSLLEMDSMDSAETPAKSDAHHLMEIRTGLGKLSRWRGVAYKEAVSLTGAIEATMDNLFSSSMYGTTFIWPFRINYAGSNQLIHLLIRRKTRGWEISYNKIEAVLSLLLYSVNDLHKSTDAMLEDGGVRGSQLRHKGPSTKQNLRFLGAYSEPLHRDLQWWCPPDTEQAILMEEAKDAKDASLTVERHTIAGCGPVFADRTRESVYRFRSWDLPKLEFVASDENVAGGAGAPPRYLAATSYDTLGLLYAQQLFSAFMWAASNALNKPIEGNVEVRGEDASQINSWQNFTLRNSRLSKVARDIEAVGLGTLSQAYQCIIPPLSETKKLPPADEIVELVRRKTEEHEQRDQWRESTDAYLWLLRAAKTFSISQGLCIKAIAVAVEHSRNLDQAIHIANNQREMLKRLQWRIEKDLEEVDTTEPKVRSQLISLYQYQGRPLRYHSHLNGPDEVLEATVFPESFNVTQLHRVEDPEWALLVKHPQSSLDALNARDIHSWTPLHYAVAKDKWTKRIIERRVNINAQDLIGWTPLHYASHQGNRETILHLLWNGAEINMGARDGTTPLHCAAGNGHTDAIGVLIEYGASADALDARGNTPLLWALMRGQELAAQLLWPEASKKQRNYHGRTILHLASNSGCARFVAEYLSTVTTSIQGNPIGQHVLQAKDANDLTPLHLAAVRGHVEVVRLLLERLDGQDIRTQVSTLSETPLHYAAGRGHVEVVRLMLERDAGEDVDAHISVHKETPLHYAAKAGSVEVVRLLLDAGAGLNAKGLLWRTPLHDASVFENAEVVHLLLERGADLEAKDRDQKTPLHLVAGKGSKSFVDLLLSKGAHTEARDRHHLTPLHLAADRGSVEIVGLLLDKGADRGAVDYDNVKPVHLAVGKGHEEMVDRLLEASDYADEETRGRREQIPLHRAAREGHASVVGLLLTLGAEREAKDDDLMTALHWAAIAGHVEVVDVLLKAGAEREATDSFLKTALHWAAWANHTEVVRLLLRHGADIDAIGCFRKTPLHFAAARGHIDVVDLLLRAGADKEAKAHLERTPLDFAISEGHHGIVAILRLTLFELLYGEPD